MIAVREEDQGGAGADAKDDDIRVGEQHAAGARSPVIDRVHTRAFDDGFHELFRSELAILRLVEVRRMPKLEEVVIIYGIGGAERVRKVFLRIVVVLIRQLRKVLRARLER